MGRLPPGALCNQRLRASHAGGWRRCRLNQEGVMAAQGSVAVVGAQVWPEAFAGRCVSGRVSVAARVGDREGWLTGRGCVRARRDARCGGGRVCAVGRVRAAPCAGWRWAAARVRAAAGCRAWGSEPRAGPVGGGVPVARDERRRSASWSARRCARICPMTAGSWLARSTLSTSEYDILRYISLSAPGTSSLAAHNVGGRGAGGRLRCLRSYAHRNQRQQGG